MKIIREKWNNAASFPMSQAMDWAEEMLRLGYSQGDFRLSGNKIAVMLRDGQVVIATPRVFLSKEPTE